MGTGRSKRSVRSVLAGSLIVGCALTAAVIGGAVPASAASVVQTIAVGIGPIGVSSDGTHVWVANEDSDTVSELYASTGAVRPDHRCGRLSLRRLVGRHPRLGGERRRDTVSEFHASTGAVVQTIAVGDYPDGVSSDGTHVWVTNSGQHGERDRASTGAVVRTIAVGGVPIGVSSDGTHVWVAMTRHGDRAGRLDRRRASRPSPSATNPGASRPTAPTSGWRTTTAHGERARRLDRGGGPDHRRRRLSHRRLLRRHPRLGDERRRQYGDRNRGLDRGGGPDHRRGQRTHWGLL